MTHELINAIVNGTPGVSVTVSAADLKEVVQTIFNQESERTAAAIQAAKEVPSLTRHETAEMLHVSYATLWRWAKEGYLKPLKIGNKSLYRKSDVERLLKMDYEKGGAA